jgi:hypothetical protein
MDDVRAEQRAILAKALAKPQTVETSTGERQTPSAVAVPAAPRARRELTQREKEERARKTRARAATPTRPLTHAERVALHEGRIAQEHSEIRKSNAERLRKYVIDADAVLRTADLLCKTCGDGTQSVKSDQVALATGLPVEFCDKVIETKWVAAGSRPVVVYEGE